MDWSKYPIEKLLYFVAGVIPGSVALLIYEASSPGILRWYFSLPLLGYRTKLALVALIVFVVGNTMTSLLTSLLGAIGGVVGSLIGYRPPASFDVAPWRDRTWRSALQKYLGPHAPSDMIFINQAWYDVRVKQIGLLPEAERPLAMFKLTQEKFDSDLNDAEWARWYDQYHAIVLRPAEHDVVLHVQRGLAFNLEAAALYALVSCFIVPAIRHWWCILPACIWALSLVAHEWWSAKRATDKWLTLSDQTTYLTELWMRSAAGAAASR